MAVSKGALSLAVARAATVKYRDINKHWQASVQRKGKPYTLLVGMSVKAPMMENSLEWWPKKGSK